MKLSLAPLPYALPKDAMLSFYKAVENTPVDIVYLGETVCLKRHEMRFSDWMDVAHQLKASGKEVVLSTQVLIESESHLKVMQDITKQQDFLVEANDMGAVRLLSHRGPFVSGMHVNHYSSQYIDFIASLGAKRFVMPFELNQHDIQTILDQKEQDVDVEVLAYGRLPLAFSARCFTARYENRPKDHCKFHCMNYPEGLCLKTQDDQELFVLNGIQIQSHATYCLLKELFTLQSMGVAILRFVPKDIDTLTVIQCFKDVLNKTYSIEEAQAMIKAITPHWCNGYWYQKPGMTYVE